MKTIKFKGVIIMTLIITLISIRAAYIMRGYFAIGGEWSIPIMVLVIYILYNSCREEFNKGGREG